MFINTSPSDQLWEHLMIETFVEVLILMYGE